MAVSCLNADTSSLPRYVVESSLVLWWPMRYVMASTSTGLQHNSSKTGGVVFAALRIGGRIQITRADKQTQDGRTDGRTGAQAQAQTQTQTRTHAQIHRHARARGMHLLFSMAASRASLVAA